MKFDIEKRLNFFWFFLDFTCRRRVLGRSFSVVGLRFLQVDNRVVGGRVWADAGDGEEGDGNGGKERR